jgi:hypothetical protein
LHLWSRYEAEGDREALRILLEYNREDVMNLVQLERIVVGVGFEVEPRATNRAPRAGSGDVRPESRERKSEGRDPRGES